MCRCNLHGCGSGKADLLSTVGLDGCNLHGCVGGKEVHVKVGSPIVSVATRAGAGAARLKLAWVRKWQEYLR